MDWLETSWATSPANATKQSLKCKVMSSIDTMARRSDAVYHGVHESTVPVIEYALMAHLALKKALTLHLCKTAARVNVVEAKAQSSIITYWSL